MKKKITNSYENIDPSKLYSITQLAEVMGLSRSTIGNALTRYGLTGELMKVQQEDINGIIANRIVSVFKGVDVINAFSKPKTLGRRPKT